MSKYVNFSTPFAVGGQLTIESFIDAQKFERAIEPPIVKLLPYNDNPMLSYSSLDDYSELQFIYINRDLWGE